MDSLKKVLLGKDFDEPPEISSIKRYVQEEFKTKVQVQARDHELIIIVPNGALASSLRLRLPDLKRRCQLTKRPVIRIGS